MLLARLPYLLYCVLSRLILPTATPIGGLARPRPRPRTATHKPIRRPTLSPPSSAPTHTTATPASSPLPVAPKPREFAPRTRPSCLSAAPPFTPHQFPPPPRPATPLFSPSPLRERAGVRVAATPGNHVQTAATHPTPPAAPHPLQGERQPPASPPRPSPSHRSLLSALSSPSAESPAPARRPNHPSPTTLRTHQKTTPNHLKSFLEKTLTRTKAPHSPAASPPATAAKLLPSRRPLFLPRPLRDDPRRANLGPRGDGGLGWDVTGGLT